MKKKIDLKILSKILFSLKKNLKKSNDILESLDSIEMLNLISQIEKKYKIKIHSKDVNHKNFSSFSKLKDLVKKNVKT